MTTRCTTPSCGRFVHPTDDRGLTLREAALLQTFPVSYEFGGNYGEIERQIGNAVPPKLAEGLGLIVRGLLPGELNDPAETAQAA
jgi:DNA (cytosine-5)-methyltransferase 1